MISAEVKQGMGRALHYAFSTGRRGLAGAFAAAAAVGVLEGFGSVRSGWAALLADLAAGGNSAAVISVGDIWYAALEGCEVFVPGGGIAFVLPVSWLLPQMLWAVIVASHDAGRRFSVADRALTLGIPLRVWMMAQCAWSIVGVIVVYSGLLAGLALGGAFGIMADREAVGMTLSISVHGLPAVQTCTFIAVSVVSSAMVACVQTLLLRACSPVASLVAVFAYLCAAFLTSSAFALGGLSMACRFFVI